MAYFGKAGFALNSIQTFDSDDLLEGSLNLYYTDDRVRIKIDSYLDVSSELTYNSGLISLATSGVTAGTVGSVSEIPVITVDEFGRVTSLTGASIDATFLDGFDSTDFARLATNNTFTGTITHNGLAPSEGTAIDQIKTFTKSLTLTTDWQDVGINAANLATGTYMVQLFANDTGSGGTNNNEYYSGVMSWYAGNTDSSVELPTDEITLHRAGGSGDAGLYLRTYKTPSADTNNLKLQIYSNVANASAANYVFKFRRMI